MLCIPARLREAQVGAFEYALYIAVTRARLAALRASLTELVTDG
jgi:hypothetical protein